MTRVSRVLLGHPGLNLWWFVLSNIFIQEFSSFPGITRRNFFRNDLPL
jgi:hypothetical protein